MTRGRKPLFQQDLKLGQDEQETHINKSALENQWEVYSDDPEMIAKLRKVATESRTFNAGVIFKLDLEQIVFVKKNAKIKRERKQYTISPEQAAIRAERMKMYHANKNK